MRKMLLWGVCALVAGQLYGQSATAAFDAFRDSVVNQQLVLRNFSGETTVHAVWTGNDFALDAPKWRTFAVVEVRSVKMKGEQIELDGDRHVMLWNDANKLAQYAVGDPVEISVDLHGGDAAQILPRLRDAIFFTSIEDGLAEVPKPLRTMVPGHADQLVPHPASGSKRCDCSEAGPCATVKGAQGFVLPKAVHTANARFSDEGRSRKISGDVVTAFVVDEAGHVRDVWVARPLGYGMDNEAAKAVLSFVFQPASCHGTPISMPLTILTNFRTF